MSQILESHIYPEKLSAILQNAEVSFDTKPLVNWHNKLGTVDGRRVGGCKLSKSELGLNQQAKGCCPEGAGGFSPSSLSDIGCHHARTCNTETRPKNH